MDKIKERIEKLRIESETNLSRAEKSDNEVKELKAELQKRENEVQSLNNKITLLSLDLERAESRIAEVKIKKNEGDKEESQVEVMTRKVQMLETHLDEKERALRETTEKCVLIYFFLTFPFVHSLTKGIVWIFSFQFEHNFIMNQSFPLNFSLANSTLNRARNYELESEKFERKSKQLDSEKLTLEKTVEDLTTKYNVVKAELESTLKGLEDL
ncbi:hypothetical protein HK096_000632 [Nowakowskiella sp. JEL0078]|nr:hypothetical protein HK096_000632 [Nowakowskiella sp. JEL0078]